MHIAPHLSFMNLFAMSKKEKAKTKRPRTFQRDPKPPKPNCRFSSVFRAA
jgi:hypothetical protein